jgi:hypothetical protein
MIKLCLLSQLGVIEKDKILTTELIAMKNVK